VTQAECHLVAAELRESELLLQVGRAHAAQAQVREALGELERVERWMERIRAQLQLLR
jgi:hypothetical protein